MAANRYWRKGLTWNEATKSVICFTFDPRYNSKVHDRPSQNRWVFTEWCLEKFNDAHINFYFFAKTLWIES